jgi:hypothetical protein
MAVKTTVEPFEVSIVISPNHEDGRITVTLVYDDGDNPHMEISRDAHGTTVEGALLRLVEQLAIEVYELWNKVNA